MSLIRGEMFLFFQVQMLIPLDFVVSPGPMDVQIAHMSEWMYGIEWVDNELIWIELNWNEMKWNEMA